MTVSIDWLAVIAGAVTAMAMGAIWYHPSVFGTKWREAVGLSEKQLLQRQKGGMIMAIVRSLILSFALYHIIYVTAAFYDDRSFISNAIGVGFWVGIAIVGLTMVMHDYFEQRQLAATKIHVRFEIVTILLTSIVIGFFAV